MTTEFTPFSESILTEDHKAELIAQAKAKAKEARALIAQAEGRVPGKRGRKAQFNEPMVSITVQVEKALIQELKEKNNQLILSEIVRFALADFAKQKQ